MNDEDLAIGIDLGTTFSCAAVFRNGKVEIIPNEKGENITPSIVSFTKEGILVGEDAIDQLIKNPKQTIYSIKRLMGRVFEDKEVQRDIKSNFWPFNIVEMKKRPSIEIKTKDEEIEYYYPEQISKLILEKLVYSAQKYLNQYVKKAVITVPAYFNDSQRTATKIAAVQAGLEVLRIINEPTAASIAYGIERKLKLNKSNENPNDIIQEDNNNEKNKLIIVFDLGGGTFDVTLLNLKIVDEKTIYDVLATSGDSHLGGDDFDKRIIDFSLKDFCSKFNIKEDEIKKDSMAMNRLKLASSKAKIKLSSELKTDIYIDEFYNNEILHCKLTRNEFEDICRDLFNRLINPLDKVLDDGKKGISEIEEIIFVGGSTRIPKIKEMIKNYYFDVKINDSINPEETIAYGAAIQAAKINKDDNNIINDIFLHDIVPFSLGISIANLSEDPDIKKKGHEMSFIIKKGTKIPVRKTEEFETSLDYQEYTIIDIYEGENKYVKDNHRIGTLKLVGLPKRLKGEVVVNVTFELDSNGILQVTATETEKGIKKSITIVNDKSLNEEDIIFDLKKTVLMVHNNDKDEKLENLKRKLKNQYDSYLNSTNKNQKYKYISNYGKILFKFINTFDKEGNDTLGNKYFHYINKLFDSYRKQIQLLYPLKEEDENLILNNSCYLLKLLSTFKNTNYQDYIELLNYFVIDLSEEEKNQNKSMDKQNEINEYREEILFKLVIFVMEIIKEKAKKLNQSKLSRFNSRALLKNCISIGERFIKSDDDLEKYIELEDRYNDCLKECKNLISEINANSLAQIEESKKSGKLFENERNLNREELLIILDNYREAYESIKSTKDEISKAIISANIVKIKFKYLGEDNYEYLKKTAENIIYSVKKNKDYEKYKWFKELENILEELNILFEKQKEKKNKDFEKKYKKELKEISEKLGRYRNKSHLEFIKYILEEYPLEKSCLKNNETIDERWKKDPKSFLEILSANYNPDNLLAKKNNANNIKKEEEFEFKNCIYKEISSEINSIISEYN